jgi:PadR family transcriptional regulator PadR
LRCVTSEMLKGHLDLLLLASIHTGPLHGYAVIDALRSLSGGTFDLPEGTIYPALHRLERSGLLRSAWVTAGEHGAGRRRRVYRLTVRGRRALADQEREWNKFAVGVRAVFEGAQCRTMV